MGNVGKKNYALAVLAVSLFAAAGRAGAEVPLNDSLTGAKTEAGRLFDRRAAAAGRGAVSGGTDSYYMPLEERALALPGPVLRALTGKKENTGFLKRIGNTIASPIVLPLGGAIAGAGGVGAGFAMRLWEDFDAKSESPVSVFLRGLASLLVLPAAALGALGGVIVGAGFGIKGFFTGGLNYDHHWPMGEQPFEN